MPNLRLLPLVALAGAFLTGLPAAAAEPAATETTAETAPATPAETAAPEPGVPEPVAPDATVAAPAEPSPAPASSPSLSEPAAPAAVNPPAAAQATVEGTKLLFLRLSLRIKRIELELFDAAPEAMVEHLSAAADLLQQLRARYLSDDEALRADRAEQYLQELMLRYTERQAAASKPERKGGKRKR